MALWGLKKKNSLTYRQLCMPSLLLFVDSLRSCFYDTGMTFILEWVSFQSLPPPQVLRFSHRGERETRVTRKWLLTKRKGLWEREKWEAKISSRESVWVWVRGSSRVKFLLYSHDKIERPSLRRVDQTRMRHSLQTINMTCDFQCGTQFVSSWHDTRMKFRRKKRISPGIINEMTCTRTKCRFDNCSRPQRAAILLDSVPHEDRHSVTCESIRFFRL